MSRFVDLRCGAPRESRDPRELHVHGVVDAGKPRDVIAAVRPDHGFGAAGCLRGDPRATPVRFGKIARVRP